MIEIPSRMRALAMVGLLTYLTLLVDNLLQVGGAVCSGYGGLVLWKVGRLDTLKQPSDRTG